MIRPGQIIQATKEEDIPESNPREQLIQKVKSLYENTNLLPHEIGKITGLRTYQVSSLIRDHIGFSRKKKKAVLKETRDQEIVKYTREHPEKTYIEIGQKFNVSANNIYITCRGNNFRKPCSQTLCFEKKIPLIKQMVLNGKTNQEIKCELHCDNKMITRFRKELNVQSNPTHNSLKNSVFSQFLKRKNEILMAHSFSQYKHHGIGGTLFNLAFDNKIIRVSRGKYKLNPKWKQEKENKK